ncbi:spore coat protein U domain-containing protein [Rouxiella sp. T17]|uniref:Csu type fimbrial protein n=1 Tax=Rouxiella sp. T17 TaxID=3085684 RepID=UPI002FCB2D30
MKPITGLRAGLNAGRRAAIMLLLSLAGMGTALADCTNGTGAATGSASFGTQSSFTVNGTQQLVTANTGYRCTGGALALLATNTIRVTLSSSTNGTGTTPRLFAAANGAIPAGYVPYTLCIDSGCANTVPIGGSYTYTQTSLLGLLGLFTGTNGTLPLYVKTTLANVPAGTYNDTLNLSWASHVCFIGILGLCSYTDQTATTTIPVTLVVTNFCYLDSAPNVSFGSNPFPSNFTTPVTSNSLSVRCTQSAAYTIKMTSSNPLVGNYRQMSSLINGTTYYLQYQILKADATVWSPTNDQGATGNGNSQAVGYTAQVNTTQANVPAGTYSDTVTVTVTY